MLVPQTHPLRYIQKTQFGFFSHYDTYHMYRNEQKIQTGSFVLSFVESELFHLEPPNPYNKNHVI